MRDKTGDRSTRESHTSSYFLTLHFKKQTINISNLQIKKATHSHYCDIDFNEGILASDDLNLLVINAH